MEPLGVTEVSAPTLPLHLFEVATETSITTEDQYQRLSNNAWSVKHHALHMPAKLIADRTSPAWIAASLPAGQLWELDASRGADANSCWMG
jgi:hypothetical protein